MEEIIKEELEKIQSLCPAGYKISDLEKQDQDMIWNAAWMIIHAEADNTEDCEEDTILEKMVKEIKRSAEDEIKLSLRISASEMVVALLDSYEEVSDERNNWWQPMSRPISRRKTRRARRRAVRLIHGTNQSYKRNEVY